MDNKQVNAPADFLVINRRHTSWLVAACIFIIVVAFAAGFIWGRRGLVLEQQQQLTESAFVDKAYFSLLSPDEQLTQGQLSPELIEVVDNAESSDAWYQAQLIGFGQLTRAQAFVAKMEQQGIQVQLETRKSHNGNKRMVWYQVVTAPTTDRRELEVLAQRLKSTEHLKNIKIVAVQQ